MSEPTFSQRIRDIADWLDSKVEIGSSSFDLAPGPVSQFDFELSEATHGLTMIAADLDRALAAPTAPTEPRCQTCNNHGMIGGPSFYAPDEGGVPCPDCATPPSAATPEPSDAERYRWLRDCCSWTLISGNGMTRLAARLPVIVESQNDDAHELDEAIDAAIRATKGGKL